MAIRSLLLGAGFAALLVTAACGDKDTSPVEISAIGAAPRLLNPNLDRLDPPSEALIHATAQGLVRFDAAGQIEPGLAQSWIVSNDGLRYTFRLRRTQWTGGGKVTAQQVVQRLLAATSGASRNPLKNLLGAIDEIEAMTDEVLEISLLTPRPNFLQMLAQPELAIIQGGRGSGPYHAAQGESVLSLHLPDEEEEAEAADEDAHDTAIRLRGERAGLAVARFTTKQADLVIGGTAGDLPIARAADLPRNSLMFDPVAGLFGLSFASREGKLADPEVRAALSMALDRAALVAALNVPELQPRESLLPAGIDELPGIVGPEWSGVALPARRVHAAQAIEAASDEAIFKIRVAMPPGPGYRLIFAHLRRDWRLIGVEAQMVPEQARGADLRFIDAVAPVELASWYLRQFSCSASAICDPSADEMMAAARIAPNPEGRRIALHNADRILAAAVPFIPLAAPVRWSLVSPRLNGFRPNMFGRHNIAELIAERP